ncbi:unnamed protein product, partial [Didymodactylos carnosus]
MRRDGPLSVQLLKKLLEGVCDGRTSFPQFHPSLIIIDTIVNGQSIHAMVDTGATTSFISQAELDNIMHPPIQPLNIQLPDAFVEIKDFSFYMCIYNPHKH